MPNKEDIAARMLALGRIMKGHFEKSGLMAIGQLETLRFVEGSKNPTMQEIARHHGITAPSATAHVDELVRAGYLRRAPDPSDRRAVRVDITPQGKHVLQRNIQKRKDIIETLFKKLSEHDRVTLNRIIEKIIKE